MTTDLNKKTGKALVGMLEELCSMTANINISRELDIHFRQIEDVRKALLNKLGE